MKSSISQSCLVCKDIWLHVLIRWTWFCPLQDFWWWRNFPLKFTFPGQDKAHREKIQLTFSARLPIVSKLQSPHLDLYPLFYFLLLEIIYPSGPASFSTHRAGLASLCSGSSITESRYSWRPASCPQFLTITPISEWGRNHLNTGKSSLNSGSNTRR